MKRPGILASAYQEVQSILQDRWTLLMYVVTPVIWCALLFGLFAHGIMRDLPVGIVNLDEHPDALELEVKLDALPSVALVSMPDVDSAKDALLEGDIYAYIVVPNDWKATSGKPDGAALELFFPKTIYAIAVSLELDIKQALLSFQTESLQKLARVTGMTSKQADRATKAIVVHSVTLGNIAFNFQAYILPTLIPGILHLAVTLALVMRIIGHWHDKSIRKWCKTGGGPLGAYIGTALPWWAYFTSLGIVFIVLLTGYFGWFAQGSLLLWFAGFALFMAVMCTLPMFLIGFFARFSPIIAVSVATGYIAPIFPYTGFSYPLDAMDGWVTWLAACFPFKHYFAFQGQVWMLDSPLSVTLLTLGKLCVFALIWVGIGYWLFRNSVRVAMFTEWQEARK
mgnify:FL=1